MKRGYKITQFNFHKNEIGLRITTCDQANMNIYLIDLKE